MISGRRDPTTGTFLGPTSTQALQDPNAYNNQVLANLAKLFGQGNLSSTANAQPSAQGVPPADPTAPAPPMPPPRPMGLGMGGSVTPAAPSAPVPPPRPPGLGSPSASPGGQQIPPNTHWAQLPGPPLLLQGAAQGATSAPQGTPATPPAPSAPQALGATGTPAMGGLLGALQKGPAGIPPDSIVGRLVSLLQGIK